MGARRRPSHERTSRTAHTCPVPCADLANPSLPLDADGTQRNVTEQSVPMIQFCLSASAIDPRARVAYQHPHIVTSASGFTHRPPTRSTPCPARPPTSACGQTLRTPPSSIATSIPAVRARRRNTTTGWCRSSAATCSPTCGPRRAMPTSTSCTMRRSRSTSAGRFSNGRGGRPSTRATRG